MATGSFPQGVGVVELQPDTIELQPDTIELQPDYAFDAVKLEMVNADGDGTSTLLDYGLALDMALRLVAACARLRRVMP